MDGNKDEAVKCLNIGRDALQSGDQIRAMKFITKARRLDPSIAVDDLLSNLQNQSTDQPTKEESSSDSSKNHVSDHADSTTQRRVPAGGSTSSASTNPVAYTEEQNSIVREIKKKKDYYEILGLEKSCTVEDIRKAYRKLSLKVHPDKNKAPGAEESFKAVSKAFQCLGDEESRKKYDLVGSDEPVYQRRRAQGFNGFYEGDVDAEEIFRNFFFGGNGMNPAMATQFGTFSFGTGTGVRTGNNGSAGSARSWIQLIPVILIVLLNFLPSSGPIYSLSPSNTYYYRFTTHKGVNFYVKSARFEVDYPPHSPVRVALEGQVERDHVSILAHNCGVEMQHLRWGMVRETPHCDSLKQFEAVA